MRKLYPFLFLSIFILSCPKVPKRGVNPSECTEDVIDLGYIKLDRKSFDFFSYQGYKKKRSLVFKNSKEERIVFQPWIRRKTYRPYVETFQLPCQGDTLNQYEYTGERFFERFKSEDLEIQFTISLYPIHTNALQFADYLLMSMRVNDDAGSSWKSNSLKIITSAENPAMKKTGKNTFLNNYELLPEMDTLGYKFFDVYKVKSKVKQDIPEFYYNKEFGLVAFQDTLSGFWIYDGIE